VDRQQIGEYDGALKNQSCSERVLHGGAKRMLSVKRRGEATSSLPHMRADIAPIYIAVRVAIVTSLIWPSPNERQVMPRSARSVDAGYGSWHRGRP
jgi:hypothetical protein